MNQKMETTGVLVTLALSTGLCFIGDLKGLRAGQPLPASLPAVFVSFATLAVIYHWSRHLWPAKRLLFTFGSLGGLIFVKLLYPSFFSLVVPLPYAQEVVLSFLHFFFGKTVPLPPVKIGLPVPWLAFLFITTGMYLAARRQGKPERVKSLFLNATVVGILLLGLIARWQALTLVVHFPLDPDAVMYRFIADHMKHLYDTSFREPLWIWTIKVWFLLFGSSDQNLRILSVFLSVGMLIASWKFFYRFTRHAGISLLTLAILSVHPYLILMSVRGLRLELLTIALLILAFYTFVDDPGIKPRTRLSGLTIGGLLSVLQQLNTLSFVILFWFYAFWRYRLGWRNLLLPFSTVALLLTPYLIYCARVFGDPLWSINVHAIWYRNYELMVVKKTGCPWYRSLAEFEKNAYLGPKITTFEYIFKMHSLKEVVLRLVEGYGKLFLYPNWYFWLQIGLKSVAAYLVYLVGLIRVIFSPYRRVLLYPLLTINLLAFLVPIGVDPRLVSHTVPFSVWVLVTGAWWCGEALARARNQRLRSRLRQLANRQKQSNCYR